MNTSTPSPEPVSPSVVPPIDREHVVLEFGDPQVGAPPGQLVIPPGSPPPRIDVTTYDEQDYQRVKEDSIGDLSHWFQQPGVVWMDVNGLGDSDIIVAIGNAFHLHKLTLEDILHLTQRPKIEEYGDHLYVVVQFPVFDGEQDFEQISIILRDRSVLSVQSTSTNRFEAIVQRLETSKGRIRVSGADYLCYALLDLTVDAYFPVLEEREMFLGRKEEEIFRGGAGVDVRDIYETRRTLMALRRNLWGIREALNTLLRDGHHQMQADTLVYLRDTYDHVVRALELSETQRETCSSLVDLHQTMLGQRMNEIMKVLTIIATIFIPLTFIAGIYGMNFDPEASPWNMPELAWRFGYPAVWTLMLGMGVLMLYLFRRLGWLGEKRSDLS